MIKKAVYDSALNMQHPVHKLFGLGWIAFLYNIIPTHELKLSFLITCADTKNF